MTGDTATELELEPTRTGSTARTLPEGAADPTQAVKVDNRALWSLLAQHLSSSWGARCYEFASYLFLIRLFPNTTLQPSIFGFFTTGAAILFSGSVGHLVDIYPRLRFVRGSIVTQKATVGASYAIFLACFLRLEGGRHTPALIGLFVVLTLLSMLLNLATIGISVAVERDWVTVIARRDSNQLTRLNTFLRRIDLLSKLLAPLFVSLLTTAASYTFAAAFLLGFAAGSMVFEFIWIEIVYRRLPVLAGAPIKAATAATEEDIAALRTDAMPPRPLLRLKTRLVAELQNWLTFVRAPIFFSSLAISLLYLTVLSFDGSFLAWTKAHHYSDAFVAGMRGIGVVTGLMGTLVMPLLEKKIGLVRAGTWSIFSEVVTLIPAVLAFFAKPPAEGKRGSALTDALLFTGMALSRIGLWSFDLCQLKELQQALDTHPEKNALMALQFSLQNVLDLAKYIVTIILRRPSQFKWAVVISFASVTAGALSYLVYARKERGHLVHLEWTEALLRKTR